LGNVICGALHQEINAQFAAVASDADCMAESARLMREFAIADRETGE